MNPYKYVISFNILLRIKHETHTMQVNFIGIVENTIKSISTQEHVIHSNILKTKKTPHKKIGTIRERERE